MRWRVRWAIRRKVRRGPDGRRGAYGRLERSLRGYVSTAPRRHDARPILRRMMDEEFAAAYAEAEPERVAYLDGLHEEYERFAAVAPGRRRKAALIVLAAAVIAGMWALVGWLNSGGHSTWQIVVLLLGVRLALFTSDEYRGPDPAPEVRVEPEPREDHAPGGVT